MVEQARAELPHECCGLLAGILDAADPERPAGRVLRRYPLANALASPKEYESDPKGLFAAFKDMRKEGLEHLAIYHSHPTSEPVPSQTDRARNWYGTEVMHLIIALQGEPAVRGWWIGETEVREAEWAVDNPDATANARSAS